MIYLLKIFFLIDKPATIENFEAYKEDNYTYFKIPSQSSSQCKHTYNIYTFDASKTLLREFLRLKENELKIITSQNLLDRTAFAKAEAVWINETSEPTAQFVPVKFKEQNSKC